VYSDNVELVKRFFARRCRAAGGVAQGPESCRVTDPGSSSSPEHGKDEHVC
jgi:hypothetical protein